MINSLLSANLLDYLTRKNSDSMTPTKLNLNGKLTKWIIGRPLDDNDVPEICKFLTSRREIVNLKLAHNNMGNCGLRMLIEARTNIEYLNVCDCKFDWEFLRFLADNPQNVQLKILKINRNFIGRKGCYYLSKFLERNNCLTIIDLSDTNHTILGVSYLMRPLKQPEFESRLTSLNLSNIVPDSTYCLYYDTKHLMELLSEFLKVTRNLLKLRLRNCRISGYDFQILLDGLLFNRTLHLLDLSDNFIGDFGFELIAQWLMLKDNCCDSKLTKLSLSNNQLSCANFEMGLFAFLKTSKLQVIDLSDNRIAENKLSLILNEFKCSRSLQKLFLWGNKLTSANFKEINKIVNNRKLVPKKVLDIEIYEINNIYYGAYKCIASTS